MFWTFLIILFLFFLVKFFFAMEQDNHELRNESLSEKFGVIIQAINNAAFNGNGSVTYLDKRSVNLYLDGENQIIHFRYGTGHLTVIWKFKYFQKEVIHEKAFNNVRNLSIFEQQRLAELMITEMQYIVNNHKRSVMGH